MHFQFSESYFHKSDTLCQHPPWFRFHKDTLDSGKIFLYLHINLGNYILKISGWYFIPKVYTDIQVTYYVWGENIKEKDIEQAIELSESKYCSVSAMLKSTAKIETHYKILAPGEAIS